MHRAHAWRVGVVVRASDLQPSTGRRFDSRSLRFTNYPGQVVHACASVTKQYKLVPAKGRWCSVAGKVTVGLASHWLCVIDSVVYTHLQTRWPWEWRWAPRLSSIWSATASLPSPPSFTGAMCKFSYLLTYLLTHLWTRISSVVGPALSLSYI